jgi:hypothetical protein
MMVGGDFFDITITGKGSYVARPEEGIAPVLGGREMRRTREVAFGGVARDARKRERG